MPEKTYREQEIEILAGKQEDAFTSQKSELGIGRILYSSCIGIGKWNCRISLELESENGNLNVKSAKFSCLASLGNVTKKMS